MNHSSTITPRTPIRVAVIGGGISGLAAALRLVDAEPPTEVCLFEESDCLGGVLRTEREQGYLLEFGGDMFTTRDPWALDLCHRVGLGEQLVETNAAQRRAFVVHRGRLCPIPDGFTLMSPARLWPLLTTPLLSPAGKLRIAREPLVAARRDDADESLADFARRRLGREAYESLVQPLIGGIYTADPEKLSMRAALPQFVEMEAEHGSLMRGARANAARRTESREESGARYGMFVAPRGGFQQLIDALAHHLADVEFQLESCISQVRLAPNGKWLVTTPAGEREFDRVVLATPARVAARLLEYQQPSLARLLEIPCASAAIALIGCHRDDIEHPLNGFGFVVPAREQYHVLSTSFSSVKFPQRAPADHVLMRVFIGGALQAGLLENSDEELLRLVRKDLGQLIGWNGKAELLRVVRWMNAMPQYHLGHLDRVLQIEKAVAELPGLALAGNAYKGVGVPYCIHSGQLAAESVLNSTG